MCLREKIGPDPRNFNQRVSLGRNDLLIRTFLALIEKYMTRPQMDEEPNINENETNKRKNVKSLEPNNYVEHIIQLEERNSILTLQLEHYTQDLNRKTQ